MTSSYFTRDGRVYVTDGPWEALLTEEQCDQLLTIWDESRAVTLFNELWTACQAVGFCPWHAPQPCNVVTFKPAKTRWAAVPEEVR